MVAAARFFALRGARGLSIEWRCAATGEFAGDRAMLGAYGRQDETVSARLVREAATEVLGGAVKSADAAGNAGWALTWQRALIGIVLMVLAAGLWMTTTDDAPHIGTLVTPSVTGPEPPSAAGETATDPMPPEDAQVLRLGDLPIEGIWNLRATDASAAMWALWDEARLAGDLCVAAVAQGLRCEKTDAEVWDAVLAINRPAMLPLRRADGFAGATVLLDITDNGALLWTGAAICTVPLAELTTAWWRFAISLASARRLDGASDRGRYRADRYPSGSCFCPVRRCACAASGGLYRGSGRAGEGISS